MSDAADPREPYLSDFARLERENFKDDPAWLRETRRKALARFRELGFPTLKQELWKYTNVAPIARTRFVPAATVPGNGLSAEALGPVVFGKFEGSELVFVNGRFSRSLSSVRNPPDGLRLGSLAEALREHPADVQRYLAKTAPYEANPFTALNTAFLQDGAFIHVPRGKVVGEPIHLLFVSTAQREPAAAYLRNLIVVEEGGQVTVTESYAGLDAGVYLTNAVTEVIVKEGGVLDHYKLQRESERAFHFATLEIEQGRGTNVSDGSFSLGGALVRNDVNQRFIGEGGEITMNGLFSVTGVQHVDNHTRIDHLVPQCTSRELYKGILDGRARGVFYGNIIVHPGAQKTNAVQTNKNLLLSKEALVDSIPGLQIYANDVKCKHGSTTGQIDEDSVFYLRSRGIDAETARAILTYAFAREVVDLIRVPAMRATLGVLLLSRLPNSEAVREAL
jgi:Fe-S cluster assembly protein SufD